MTWNSKISEGNESLKCKWDIVPFTRGQGLDIGCSVFKPFQHFIGVDDCTDTRLFGQPITPDVRCDARKLTPFADGSMDFVYSSHTLEHIVDYKSALKEWWRVVRVGGNMILYLPHKDFYPNIGESGANPDHKHDFLPQDIVDAMKEFGGWDLLVNEERDVENEYSFLQVFKKRDDAEQTEPWKNLKTSKTCGIFRIGAWGDVLQMSSILPGLKEQGFHITVITHGRSEEVLRHEPMIDHIIVQDIEQVPDHQLREYWAHLRKKYDRFINLSESVEHQFLAVHDEPIFFWPHKARHAVMNHNYGEILHYLAQVPWNGAPESRFVITDDERKWAKAQKVGIGGSPLILWSVAGSAIHKVYPYMDEIIDSLEKEYPSVKIVTVGDDKARDIFEAAWTDKKSVVRRSGVWNIRQTMAFAKVCDLVMGPETGVMNSVAMDQVQKIVMLSHSSVENLTRDWVNTISIHSTTTPCYPCHKMISRWDHCVKHGSGASACMAAIPVATVMDSINSCIPTKEAMAA